MFEIECDILHQLYKMNGNYKKALEIMLWSKSRNVFKFFEEQYLNFNRMDEMNENFIKLLEIDPNKTVFNLLSLSNQLEIKRRVVRECIEKINQLTQNSEFYLLKFLDALFEYSYDEYKKIVVESDSCKKYSLQQFSLYVKYDKDKLMGFLQKIDV